MFRWALWWPILVLGFPDADEASLAAMLSRPSPQDMGVEEAVRLAAESVPESFKKLLRQHFAHALSASPHVAAMVSKQQRRGHEKNTTTEDPEVKELVAHINAERAKAAAKRAASLNGSAVTMVGSNHSMETGSGHALEVTPVEKIYAIINKLIMENQAKVDVKLFDCKKQQRFHAERFEISRASFYDVSSRVQALKSRESYGRLERQDAETRTDELVTTRDQHKRECASNLGQLSLRLERVEANLATAKKVSEGTSCATKPGTAFLQRCLAAVRGKAPSAPTQPVYVLLETNAARLQQTGPSFLQLGSRSRAQRSVFDSAVDDELSERHNEFSDFYFQSRGRGAVGIARGLFQPSAEERNAEAILDTEISQVRTQTNAPMEVATGEDVPPNAWKSEDDILRRLAMLTNNTVVTELGPGLPPMKDHVAQEAEAASYACTVAAAPDCPMFRDRLEEIVAEAQSELEEVRDEIQSTHASCTGAQTEFDNQIAEMQTKAGEGSRIEAETGGQGSQSQGDLQSLEREGRELLAGGKKAHEECTTELHKLERELCASKTLKREVQVIEKKAGGATDSVDCEVSDWEEGECYQTEYALALEKSNFERRVPPGFQEPLHSCGEEGGLQFFRRTPVGQPRSGSGAACPPLTLKMHCNARPCPVNCLVGDWEGWSSCSKGCDGGMKRRVRPVLRQAENGGEGCDVTKEEEPCNLLACDRPCELSDWAPWTPCSRPCGGGMQWMTREVERRASGDGKCPKKFSNARYHSRDCNSETCPGLLTCRSKLDLVVMLDSSGSLGPAGYAAAKQGLLNMVKGMDLNTTSGALVGVLRYSWSVQTISQLTDDKKALAAAITKAPYMGWTSNIGGALRSAENMLQFGRRNANSVCMLWADGPPTTPSNKYDASQAGHSLRTVCRVMVVAVRPALTLALAKPWVSHPSRENFFPVHKPEDLSNSTQELIARLCPVVQVTMEPVR
mmetsp:Transcript_69652/g.160048  ORF Transcript_69652/g.160048 Transcript_69652/m.160048 type:complete len:966 (-) Transcript_69652:102-2999(-)